MQRFCAAVRALPPYTVVVLALFFAYAGSYFCRTHILLVKKEFLAAEHLSGALGH